MTTGGPTGASAGRALDQESAAGDDAAGAAVASPTARPGMTVPSPSRTEIVIDPPGGVNLMLFSAA